MLESCLDRNLLEQCQKRPRSFFQFSAGVLFFLLCSFHAAQITQGCFARPYLCLLLLVGIGLQEGVEVAHGQIVAPDDAHVGDVLAVLIQLLHCGDDVVQMLLGQTAAVDGKTDHVGQLGLLLRGLQVILHGVVAQLGHADAVAADQLQREALAREGVMTALAVEEFVHVDVHGVAAGGEHNALDAGLIEALAR